MAESRKRAVASIHTVWSPTRSSRSSAPPRYRRDVDTERDDRVPFPHAAQMFQLDRRRAGAASWSQTYRFKDAPAMVIPANDDGVPRKQPTVYGNSNVMS